MLKTLHNDNSKNVKASKKQALIKPASTVKKVTRENSS